MEGPSERLKHEERKLNSTKFERVSSDPDEPVTHLYFKRYVILLIFIFYSVPNTFQWIQYAILTNIITDYYNVSPYYVNWTSTIFLAIYIPLLVPCTWLLEKKGLRFVVLLGAFANCLAAWIKCVSISPDRFWVVMIAQTIAGMSQLFILGIPAQLAATWFGTKEVSRACGFGFLGIQSGLALGFVVPPAIVPNSEDKAIVADGLFTLSYMLAGVTTTMFIIIIFFFPAKPPIPPSQAQAKSIIRTDINYFTSIKNLITNPNFILLNLSYGLNVGVFYAISTLMNQTILFHFPGKEQEAGLTGLIIVIAGLAGSGVCGLILDKTHKFKETTVVVYFFSLCGMIAYMIALEVKIIELVFLFATMMGFFMTGYLPIGFEFAAELTYPESEGISSGLLNAVAQCFGMVAIFGGSFILEGISVFGANLFLVLILTIGMILTILIKPDLRRFGASIPIDRNVIMLEDSAIAIRDVDKTKNVQENAFQVV